MMMIAVALSLSMRKVLMMMMELLVVDVLLALVRTMRQARL